VNTGQLTADRLMGGRHNPHGVHKKLMIVTHRRDATTLGWERDRRRKSSIHHNTTPHQPLVELRTQVDRRVKQRNKPPHNTYIHSGQPYMLAVGLLIPNQSNALVCCGVSVFFRIKFELVNFFIQKMPQECDFDK